MHVFTLFLVALAACTAATAAAPPPPPPSRTEPGALAALARDTAVALGLAPPVMRDQLELTFEPSPPLPRAMTIIRVVDRDRHAGLRLVITDDLTGPRVIAAWPL